MSRFLLAIAVTSLTLLVACSSQPSGGDLTLASSPQPSNTASNKRSLGAVAANEATPAAPTNFQTGSGATINIGTQYNDTTVATKPAAPIVSTQSVTQPSPLRSPVPLPPAATTPTPPKTVSAPPASPVARVPPRPKPEAQTSSNQQGVQPSKKQVLVLTKPGCTGKQCPTIKFERLSFTEHERFSNFVEQSLLSMAQIESNQAKNFETLNQLSDYFWATARPRNEILLRATLKRANPTLVVVQLDSYLYSGGAHGNSTTQYINWLPQSDIVVNLPIMIPSDNMPAFEAALKRQHTRWLQTNELAKADPQAYNKMWPFRLSENAALLEEGIAVTYDPFEIGPYALGMPTLVVPYAELQGILRPELMPR